VGGTAVLGFVDCSLDEPSACDDAIDDLRRDPASPLLAALAELPATVTAGACSATTCCSLSALVALPETATSLTSASDAFTDPSSASGSIVLFVFTGIVFSSSDARVSSGAVPLGGGDAAGLALDRRAKRAVCRGEGGTDGQAKVTKGHGATTQPSNFGIRSLGSAGWAKSSNPSITG
jgi:hypothetical protein|tara:strand:- start:10062 stop:10595 length:534 start_codon:yes stop_codon:yes gene_type:complete